MEKHITLLVKNTSGNPVNDPLFLKMSAFRKSSVYPAGVFAEASFILPRSILSRPTLLDAGFEVTVVNGGMVVYHGWVDGLEDIAGESGEGTLVTCIGDWAKYMERRGLERRWVDADITDRWWRADETSTGYEIGNVQRHNVIRITPQNEQWVSGDEYGLDYQTPTGETIKRITCDYDMVEEAGQDWVLGIYNGVSDLFAITTSSTGSQNVAVATSAAQIFFRSSGNNTPTKSGDDYGELSNILVYAGRNHASANTGAVFNVYEMGLDIVDLLGVDETSISADITDLDSSLTLSLVPFVSNGYEAFGSQLARAAGYGDSSQNAIGFGLRPPNYAGDNLPRLFLETYPDLTDYDYETSSDESALSVRMNLDDVWNWIVVEYSDDENEPQRVTPDDDANLKDTTSIADYGQREVVLRIGQSDAGTATAFGQRFLERHKKPTYAVTRPLRVSRLRAKGGAWVPAMYIHAGKRVRINDLPNRIAQASPTGTTFLITKADYEHETGIATLSIGGVPDDLAILLAQMQEGY